MHPGESGADERFSRLFGDNVRRARAIKGWSQRRLAEALDVRGVKLDPSAVTRIERGVREVKLREAAAHDEMERAPAMVRAVGVGSTHT